ncbi:MAG: hypothetical protein ASARMPRED_006753 [Alectoria sarmentosa]|nr:MAG: hypothetical protein ASARMPRED_006753 [Alectoria sarmentosa]
MVDPVGTTLGAASLALQLLNGCVKGYRYFIAAAGMPEDCRYMRTRLQIEYARLLDWCEVAGLIENGEGQGLPESFKVDTLVLFAVLSEIRVSMDELADVSGKYIELNPEMDAATEKSAIELDLLQEFSHITLSYDKKGGHRKYPRGFNSIVRGTSMGSSIVRNPKRLQWIAFDKNTFLKLLRKLTELNDYLYELMHGHRARALELATQKSYLEMVQMRASVEELKHLVTAAMLLQEHDSGEFSSAPTRRRNEKALASLADFKRLNATFDELPHQHSKAREQVKTSSHLTYSQVFYDEKNVSTLSVDGRIRVEGKLCPGDGTEQHVWIEWKAYKTKYSRRLEKHVPLPENLKRVKELVLLLKSDKPNQICAPQCLGYFDDRDDVNDSQHDARFGLVFRKPENSNLPVSLRQMISKGAKASLTDRILLAHKISTCVLYLHAVNWLHKGLRSDNVMFLPEDSSVDTLEINQPYVTGFEYARPDRDGETTTSGVEVNDYVMLYVHPDYQGSDAKGTYRKTFDIYSLGIILLEIAYWKRIENILAIDMNDVTPAQLKGIRGRLLQPGSEYLAHLRTNVGDRYYTAVKSCIDGCPAFGVSADESEINVHTGATLQHSFTMLVVDALDSIVV